jgi:AcrR family transcriptional regulator
MGRSPRQGLSAADESATVDADDVVDGRRKRGEDNRISQAFISLIAAGVVTPTAEDVASQAGVGLRSVFRHFSDMETLYREMVAHSHRLASDLVGQGRPDGDWRTVLDGIVDARMAVYESVMPFQIAAQVHQYESAHLRLHQETFADLQRSALLESFPKGLLRDKALLEALNLALSFETWMRLRREQRLNQAAARRVVLLTCSSLLQEKVRR